MSINGLQQQYFANSLDGLTYLDVNGIAINGQDIDVDNLVPYTGANKPINAGVQPIRTSYAPVANNDVVNLLTLQNAVAYIEGINVANFVPYTGANANVNLGTHTLTANKLVAPTAEIDTVKVNSSGTDYSISISGSNLEFTNLSSGQKIYTDGASLWLPERLFAGETVYSVDSQLTGNQYFSYGTANQFSISVNGSGNYEIKDNTGTPVLELSKTTGLTVSKLTISSVPSATPTYALGVNGSGGVVSFPVPSATNLLPLNNTWTGTNTFNNNVVMGDTYSTNVNSAFASIQAQIANETNFATGGSDFTGAMPVSVLTKPSTYYNLAGAGNFGMSVGLDLGYTGGSFTAGSSTTISGSWTANTVSSRIATITFDVSAHIGKSLRCVWEGVSPLVFTTSPPPFFTVVNGATTVYSSPQPISGTNTYAWNFTPTVGTTTITYTVQSTGTPSLPAFSWTRFTIKQIGASRLAYKTGAKYTATFSNMIASQLMYLSVYQYTTAGGTPLAISDISNIPITTSAQTITITFNVNIFPTNLGTVIFFFQPSSANQYVRFDSAILTRADMTVSGNVQSALTVNSQIISANPSGNSGNGVVVNMSSVNGAFGSIECYQTNNIDSTSKLPLALQAYGGTVGVGLTNPVATFQVIGTGNICGGTNFANLNSYMQTGSLTIGDPTRNYGGGNLWTSNTAGLLLECLDNTEIAVHDAGTRVASLMRYNANTLTMGRDMGWGVANTAIAGTLDTASNITMASGTFRKNSAGAPNSWITMNGGDGSNSPFMEFVYGSLRRGYIGNATASALFLVAENNCDLNIYTGGSLRMIIKNSGLTGFGRDPSYTVDINGNQRIYNGLNANDSMTVYGPNASWGAYLIVGSGTDRAGGATAQVISTNGNLHLDGGNSNAMYYGYYANSRGTPNPHYFYGSDIQFSSGLPQQDVSYAWPITMNGAKLFRSQSVIRRQYQNNSIGWGGGVNTTYAFYRYNGNTSVRISGKLSYYVSGNVRAYPVLRTYSQNYGTMTYWSLEAFTNVGSNHTTFPIDVVLSGGDLSYQTGWFDIYVYNNGNCNTDTNDQLWINVEVLSSSDF